MIINDYLLMQREGRKCLSCLYVLGNALLVFGDLKENVVVYM